MVILLGIMMAGSAYAEEEQEAELPLKAGVKTVKSLLNHRRQDVREEEERKLNVQKEEAAKETRERTATPQDQIKFVEQLLKIRIGEAENLPAGTPVGEALAVVESYASRAGAPLDVEWVESADGEINLQCDVNLYGCTVPEALAQICQATNCYYMVRRLHIGLMYLGKGMLKEKIACPSAVFYECFRSRRAYYTEEYKKIPARSNRGKEQGILMDEVQRLIRPRGSIGKIAGVYDADKSVLLLEASPYTMFKCKTVINDAYHRWLKSSKSRSAGAQDAGSRRYKLERKLNELSVVPIEFVKHTSLQDVVRYLNVLVRHGKHHLNVTFRVLKEHEDTTLGENLMIPDVSLLEAVFCVTEAYHGSYTVQGSRMCIAPNVLEKRTYTPTTVLLDYVHYVETGKKGRAQTNTEPSSTAVKKALNNCGACIPANGSSILTSDNILKITSTPRTFFIMDRLLRLVRMAENP